MKMNESECQQKVQKVKELIMATEPQKVTWSGGGFDNSRYKITDRLGKWVNKDKPWFSLNLDGSDPHALVAAQAYADSVRRANRALSDDLTGAVKAAKRRQERDANTNVKK